jgi:hypothetical protein
VAVLRLVLLGVLVGAALRPAHAAPVDLQPTPYQFPARIEPTPVRVLRLRFWADADFRAATPRWRIKVRAWLGELGRTIGPTLAVTFEADRLDEWTREHPLASLDVALDELAAKDRGGDVDLVVGLVSALPLVATAQHHIGQARIGGKHLVMRGMGSAEDARTLYQLMPKAEPRRVEELYARRLLHKELSVFLHEWAHTLGAGHAPQPTDIMSPVYSPVASVFSLATLELMDAAITRRKAPAEAPPRPAPRPAPPAVAEPTTPSGAHSAAAAAWVGRLLDRAAEQSRGGDTAGARATLDEAADRADIVAPPGDAVWMAIAEAGLDAGALDTAARALARAGGGPRADAARQKLARARGAQRRARPGPSRP